MNFVNKMVDFKKISKKVKIWNVIKEISELFYQWSDLTSSLYFRQTFPESLSSDPITPNPMRMKWKKKIGIQFNSSQSISLQRACLQASSTSLSYTASLITFHLIYQTKLVSFWIPYRISSSRLISYNRCWSSFYLSPFLPFSLSHYVFYFLYTGFRSPLNSNIPRRSVAK